MSQLLYLVKLLYCLLRAWDGACFDLLLRQIGQKILTAPIIVASDPRSRRYQVRKKDWSFSKNTKTLSNFKQSKIVYRANLIVYIQPVWQYQGSDQVTDHGSNQCSYPWIIPILKIIHLRKDIWGRSLTQQMEVVPQRIQSRGEREWLLVIWEREREWLSPFPNFGNGNGNEKFHSQLLGTGTGKFHSQFLGTGMEIPFPHIDIVIPGNGNGNYIAKLSGSFS